MKTTSKHILIVDLEATCWSGKVPEGQQNEVIEIGVCILDTETGQISKNRGLLVKPERSEVSAFCTELTTITPELLDREGVSFAEACDMLRNDYQSERLTWGSYGEYDCKMMKQQCAAWDMSYPLSEDHINVKALFARIKGMKKAVGMAGALGILEFQLDGTHHRGVDDAKNIAKIMYWNLQQGKTNVE
jgi:inhibitor of KinA sporulation pathway (predicted exonuclease)